jgi:hypothetical protein
MRRAGAAGSRVPARWGRGVRSERRGLIKTGAGQADLVPEQFGGSYSG